MQSQAFILSIVIGLYAGAISAQQLAPSAPAAPAANQVVQKQQAAIEEARKLMSRPLASAPEASGLAQATKEEAHPSVMPKVLKILGLLLLAVAAAFFFYKSQQPESTAAPEAAATGAAASVRAVLERQESGPGTAGLQGVSASNPRFMELAVANGILTQAERQSLSSRFQGSDFAVMLYLVEQRPQLKDALGKLWGDSLEIAYTDPTKTIVQYELVNKLPKNFAEQNNVIPLYVMENVITTAMSDPRNKELQRQVEGHMDALISPVFALPDQIRAALEIARISLRALTDQLSEKLASASHEGARIGRLAEEKSVAEFVRGLFLLALKQRASDIHIEPHDDDAFIRLRIDGALQEYLRLPMRIFPSLSNVIKIMAGVDIGERRRPQDGRITLKLPDRDLEFRFSCVPTIYGEKIVLRLLGQNQFMSVPSLEDLNFSKPILDGIRQIIESPNGVFFVTGPTGSGKTTTLYAALNALNRKDLNIMTIEDPVEYRLPGINQVQVNPQAGVTFAAALRSFLRQDPDVMLVGEIRDLETAMIASQAALTGHLVLTTLHTNNALQAVTRLIQIGVEPFLVAPSIIGVMAQRLVRRLCENCKEKYALAPEEIQKYFEWDGRTEVFFHRKKGCDECNFTGYSGRVAIHELFIIDDEMRNYIARNASILDIQKYAHDSGFTTMRYDGFKKILMGLTTVEEVNQVALASD
ncbi:MAG: GspE/PulE family protein [Kiritimatiellia bacterium]